MGMAAGYNLAKEGKKVLMFDAFDPPHNMSSHEGDTRYISPASGEGGPYVPLTLRALELWRELQEDTLEQIYINNGAITFGLKDSKFVEVALQSAKDYDLDIVYFENGAAFKEYWPDMNFPDNVHGLLEKNGGTLSTTNAIRNFKRLALLHGAEIKVKNPVLEVDVVSDDLVRVTAQDGTYEAEKVIISAGPFAQEFFNQLGLDHIELSVDRRVIAWFDADQRYYSTDVFPSFYGDTDMGVYYGFPDLKYDGLKIGKFYEPDEEEAWSDNIEPGLVNRQFGAYKRDERELRKFLAEYMPLANGRLKKGAVGMFTDTADEDYIIDFHPEHRNVIIAAGFSGNGFKAVPAVGEILMQLATRGHSDLDISDFRITRDALKYNFSEQTESLTWGKLKNI